jgi:hypothetical protein
MREHLQDRPTQPWSTFAAGSDDAVEDAADDEDDAEAGDGDETDKPVKAETDDDDADADAPEEEKPDKPDKPGESSEPDAADSKAADKTSKSHARVLQNFRKRRASSSGSVSRTSGGRKTRRRKS